MLRKYDANICCEDAMICNDLRRYAKMWCSMIMMQPIQAGATCANDTSDATDAGDASGMQTMQAKRSNARDASYANDAKRRVQNARSASFKMTCIGESERTA